MGEYEGARSLFGVETIPAALAQAAGASKSITVLDADLGGDRVTHAELFEKAVRIGRGLRGAGLDPGARVAVLASTSHELLAVLFGIWAAGGVPVVIPLPRRADDLEAYRVDVAWRVQFSGAALLVVADAYAPYVDLPEPGPADIRVVSQILALPPTAEEVTVAPDDVALLQFTSGTTSSPRVVTLTHRQILSNLASLARALGWDSDRDVMVSWLPLFHDMGLIGLLLGSVAIGVDLILLPTEEFLARPGAWVEAMSRYRGTMTISPNFGYALAARFLEAGPRDVDLSAIRLAGNGAEPIDYDTLDNFARAAAPYGFDPRAMRPMYGLAECTLGVSVMPTDEAVRVTWVSRDELETTGAVHEVPASRRDARPVVCCGRPLPGVEVEVRDGGDRALGRDVVGEICVRSPGVMLGYWKDPAATQDVLRDGWLRTGDLGFLRDEGLYVCGRLQDVIVVGGRNLYPEEYEFWTERTEGVRRGNVIAFALPERDRMIVVAETALQGEAAAAVGHRVYRMLSEHLGRNPEEVVMVRPGTLPKTSSGKRRRSACRLLYVQDRLRPVTRVDGVSAAVALSNDG